MKRLRLSITDQLSIRFSGASPLTAVGVARQTQYLGDPTVVANVSGGGLVRRVGR